MCLRGRADERAVRTCRCVCCRKRAPARVMRQAWRRRLGVSGSGPDSMPPVGFAQARACARTRRVCVWHVCGHTSAQAHTHARTRADGRTDSYDTDSHTHTRTRSRRTRNKFKCDLKLMKPISVEWAIHPHAAAPVGRVGVVRGCVGVWA